MTISVRAEENEHDVSAISHPLLLNKSIYFKKQTSKYSDPSKANQARWRFFYLRETNDHESSFSSSPINGSICGLESGDMQRKKDGRLDTEGVTHSVPRLYKAHRNTSIHKPRRDHIVSSGGKSIFPHVCGR